jgi:hypothetical protein
VAPMRPNPAFVSLLALLVVPAACSAPFEDTTPLEAARGGDPERDTPTADERDETDEADVEAPSAEPTSPGRLAAAATVTVEQDVNIGGFVGDRVTWTDSVKRPRTAFLVKNNALDPAGAYGGYARTFTYKPSASVTRTVSGGSPEPGFGFVMAQRSTDYANVSSKYLPGTRTLRSVGAGHAVIEYGYAQLKTSAGEAVPVRATVQWSFVSGRDYPLWSITYDSSAAGANALSLDTKSPYGALEYTGSTGTVDGVGWGDRRKFTTTATTGPVTLNSAWSYSATNVVPYVRSWSNATKSEMGLVQSQRWASHDAGYGWFYSNWGKTSATRVIDAGSPAGQLMPATWNWTYLLNQHQLPAGTSVKTMGWGMNFGAVGQTSFPSYGYQGNLSGYPYQSYGTFIVLGAKAATTNHVAQVERMTASTLTATRGLVVTSGAAGVGRSDTVTYAPAGYNHVYATWDVRAEPTTAAAVMTLDPKSKSLKNPVFRLLDYARTSLPTGVRMGTTSLVDGVDYEASRDGTTVWLTLKKTITTPTTIGLNEDGGNPGTGLDPFYQHFDINHVLSTGQSNSVANAGTPVLSTTQPFSNLMFNVGVMTATNCNGDGCTTYQTPTSLVPLVEGDKFLSYAVETASAGIANEIANIARSVYLVGQPAGRTSHDVLVSLHGRSGNSYECLRRGGCSWHSPSYIKAFDDGMRQVQDARALAAARGASYVVRAVTAIHGETDHYYPGFPLNGTDGTPGKIQNYSDALLEWQVDYETQVKARTGQTLPVPLFISQMSGWTDKPASTIANLQLDAHVRAPGKVVLVTPGYPLPFASDCLHYSAHSNRRLGEYFAKAYLRTVLEGKAWEPVRPTQVTRVNNVLTVKFAVPVPPLVLDTTLVTNPGNYGFRYTDSASTPAITGVAVTAPDTVTITLASTPTGANKHLTYAQNAPSPACPGPTQGPRGNVRDSDTTPSLYGYSLYNWSVHFDLTVP